MLRETRARLPIPLVQGIDERLPSADASFDFLSMGYALRHVADLQGTFREYRRVLKPGATVLILDFRRPSTALGRAFVSVLGRVVPLVARLAARSDKADLLMQYYWDTVAKCVPPGTIVAAMEAGGFRTATFQVRLRAQPSSNVVASVVRVSGDANISVVSGSSLTFTTSYWNVNQAVTLGAGEDADTTNGSAVIRVSATGMASVDVMANELENDLIAAVPSDFNQDGDPDILWRHKVTGEVALWYMNGASPVFPQGIATVANPNWKIAGVGDFDRDGDPDILWWNQGSGEVALWYMNGASPVFPQGIATVPTNCRIMGVADFNRDGNPDILCRNQTTGGVVLWYMNGGNPVSPQAIATVPDLNWEIVAP